MSGMPGQAARAGRAPCFKKTFAGYSASVSKRNDRAGARGRAAAAQNLTRPKNGRGRADCPDASSLPTIVDIQIVEVVANYLSPGGQIANRNIATRLSAVGA
jgi:hypothetical protein